MVEGQRLVDIFRPTHYDIFLDINRETKVIAGKTTIKGSATQTAIILNQKYLSINNVTVDGQTVIATTNDEDETLTFTAPEPGELTIVVDYTAPLTDTMMGIYPSYYQIDGQKKATDWYAI